MKKKRNILRNSFFNATLQIETVFYLIQFKMKTNFTYRLYAYSMHKSRTALFLFIAFIFLIGLNGWGQSYATLGTGGTGAQYSSSWANPYRHLYEDFRGQYIFTVAELTSAGLSAGSEISALSFYVRTKNSTGTIENFTISLAHTSTSNFSSAFLAPSFTTCYTGNVTTVANSWNTHTFTTSFTWNGTSNIIVQSCFDDNSWTSSDEYYYQVTVDNVHYTFNDNESGCSMASYSDDTWRPVTRFTYTNCTPQTTYYSKSSGNLDDLSTWGSNADGTGCQPANFTTAGVTYNVHNNTAPTTSGAWAVSGAGSKVVFGDPDVTVSFTAGGALNFDCDIELANDGTLNLNDNNMSLEGDIIRSSASAIFNPGPSGTNTITFDGGTDQYVNVTTAGGTTPADADLSFYDVVVSNNSTVRLYYKFSNSKKLNINDLNVNSGSTLHFISD